MTVLIFVGESGFLLWQSEFFLWQSEFFLWESGFFLWQSDFFSKFFLWQSRFCLWPLYQVDLVELIKELNMKDWFKYLLTWVDHFSKYARAIPIKNKETVSIRNTFVQVFIRGYPKYIKSDNGKLFIKQTI